jgi:hypothetical protein
MSSKAAVVAVFCVLLPACSRDAAEDRAVIAALNELRDSAAADLPARRALIEKLEKLPASTPLARSARDECVKAYRALVDGKEAVAKLEHAIDDPNASAKDALAGLAGAEDLIKRSEQAMPACDKAAADLSLSRR